MIVPFGFAATVAISAGTGIAITLLIAFTWRHAIWPAEAPANRR